MVSPLLVAFFLLLVIALLFAVSRSARSTTTRSPSAPTATVMARTVEAGVMQDNLDALRRAGEQSDAEAQFSLGVMYADGDGVPAGPCRRRALAPSRR